MAEDASHTNDYENMAYEGHGEEDDKNSSGVPDYENVNAVTVEPDDVEFDAEEGDTLERRQARERLYFERDGKRLRVDYILTYQDTDNPDKLTMRESFQASLEDEGLIVDVEDKSESTDLKTYYLKVHATWPALASGAELMNINKRLKTYGTKKDEDDEVCSCCTSPFEVSEDIVKSEGDFFTAGFSKDHLHWFEIDEDNKEDFFTNSERSLITKEFLDRTSFSSEHEEKMKYGDYIL